MYTVGFCLGLAGAITVSSGIVQSVLVENDANVGIGVKHEICCLFFQFTASFTSDLYCLRSNSKEMLDMRPLVYLQILPHCLQHVERIIGPYAKSHICSIQVPVWSRGKPGRCASAARVALRNRLSVMLGHKEFHTSRPSMLLEVNSRIVPEDSGEPTLQGCSVSALPPKQTEELQAGKPGGCGPILDDGELLQQLFTLFGGIPFSGEGKPAETAPERRRSLS